MIVVGTTRQNKGTGNRKSGTTETRRNFEYVCRIREATMREK